MIKRADLVQTTAVSIDPAPRRKRWGRREWSQALLRAGRQNNNVLFTPAADARQEVCVLAKYISQGRQYYVMVWASRLSQTAAFCLALAFDSTGKR